MVLVILYSHFFCLNVPTSFLALLCRSFCLIYYLLAELERQRYSVLIVCHLAVLRCIYAYFMDVKVRHLSDNSISFSSSFPVQRFSLLT
jgi:hypothetical protein